MKCKMSKAAQSRIGGKRASRRIACLCLAAMTAFSLTPAVAGPALADTAVYTDVPADSWAKDAVYSARDYGLMSGREGGLFGYGATITKAELATILGNMLKWEKVTPATPSFGDVQADQWYYSAVETALANGAVDRAATFSPDAAATREELAVMFVRALGLSDAARAAETMPLPFSDVTANKGFIAVAYDIGMINGTTASTFEPASTVTREQAAAMLTRVYAKYYGKTDFLHGFYAISAYSQKDLTSQMDAVTLGWSQMAMSGGSASLDMTSGQYKVPEGYELVTNYLDQNKTKAHLGVYMDSSQGVSALLANEAARKTAVDAIMEELSKTYETIGKNPYSGVTIDFEGLKGAEVKAGFNAFLTDLSGRLKAAGKTLYVAVQPTLQGSAYFDGFDYRTIGELADKVILMAHDYNPTSLKGYVGTEWHKNAALTPIGQIYYSLKAVTDSNTGVADKNKLVLAVSFAAVGWQLTEDEKLAADTPAFASTQAVHDRLTAEGTVTGFSQVYRNPYMTYTTAEGNHMFLWYENGQSVFEKTALARMMGISGVSLWRLGNIPDYSDYQVMDRLQ